MCQYFDVSEDFFDEDGLLNFVKINVSDDVNEEDIELYKEIAEDLVDKSLLTKNRASIVSIVAYSCQKDIDLEGWLPDYVLKTEFSKDHRNNFLEMVDSLGKFLENN
jgi:hypothetical protein